MAASTKDLSAQQAQHGPVRLLIAERSENAAYQFDSLLRDAGIATRLEIVDLPMAVDKLAHADMMLCNAALQDLPQMLPRLASLAPRVPIIVISNEDAAMAPAEGMELGAVDVVRDSDSQHLVLVVKREIEHVCQNIRLRQAKKALAEAEQRCQLLLQSSRAAIAYVHEGMHIYANEHYLELFGFQDVDELLGLPLIDLLDADSGAVLKSKLKTFRQDGEELSFDFGGISTNGRKVTGNLTLAAAEYEGEHCLQITVRPSAGSNAGGEKTLSLVSDSGAGEADDVPLLEADAAVEGAAQASADDATDDQVPTLLDQADPATSADSESSLHQEPAEDAGQADAEPAEEQPEAVAPADAGEPVSADASHPPGGEADPEEAGPAARSNGAAQADTANAKLSLEEFLRAGEAMAADSDNQLISVFVAQVDGYEELQRAFGLAGVGDTCRQIEAGLVAAVSGPITQISPSQWAILICDQTRDEALARVEAYRETVESLMFEVREKTVRPTCTFGGAILNSEGHDSIAEAFEATLDNAFTTLRKAVDSGQGNQVVLAAFENADQEFDDEANRILQLISEAIENQSFTLLFQPIISLRGDSDEHYEVFLRMSDREGRQMAPGEFLRTAIDNGVAGKIDRWVILQSIKMLSGHRANGHNTRLTINLTSNSVADPEFIQWLGVAIKAARLPSDAVIFQITEADAAQYVRQTREFVEGLKNLHCRSSLSRFGLAPEPFELLNHIPVDFVKLDGSIIEALDKNPDKKSEVTELVRDLQNSGKLTIVPMVESAGLLSTLWQAGVNYIQGHYLQEPSTNMDYDFSTDD